MRVLFHAQTFKEPETSGIYLGFIAGAIGSTPAKAEQLVTSFFPVPPEDEWVIVRAIAYSGLPDWKNLLRRIAPRMPGRKVMIDSYLAGTLPTLTDIPLEETKPGMLDKLRGVFTHNPLAKDDKPLRTALTFAGNQDLLDTLWGYYFATGSHIPIQRIVQMLPWAKSRDTVDKLTVGSMARYTLASYAVRDAGLREFLRGDLARHPATTKAPLGEVIEAADTVQLAALRKDALAAVEELKTKGSDSRRNLDFWGQVGVGAVALGCVSAAALGQGRGRYSLRDRRFGVAGSAVILGKAAVIGFREYFAPSSSQRALSARASDAGACKKGKGPKPLSEVIIDAGSRSPLMPVMPMVPAPSAVVVPVPRMPAPATATGSSHYAGLIPMNQLPALCGHRAWLAFQFVIKPFRTAHRL